MKVLFYPVYNPTRIDCNRIYCDYQLDCLFHGLRTLLGENCVDVDPFPIWYDDVKKEELYGNGFTIYGLLPRIPIDRYGIEEKIRDKYYDQIIIGIHNNRFNNHLNSNIVQEFVSYGNKVKVICGNDDPTIDTSILPFAPLFKREIVGDLQHNLFPISFAIPEEKIVPYADVKIQVLSGELPNHQGVQGWKIKDETEYYRKYQDAVYGLTYKKGGWDSLRHYEILMNGCVPLFLYLDQCPNNTLSNFPKEIINETNSLSKVSVQDGYLKTEINKQDVNYIIRDIIPELLQWTRTFLTTKKLAQYVLENG